MALPDHPISIAINGRVGDVLRYTLRPEAEKRVQAFIDQHRDHLRDLISHGLQEKAVRAFIARGALAPGEMTNLALALKKSQAIGVGLERMEAALGKGVLFLLEEICESVLEFVLIETASSLNDSTPDGYEVSAEISDEERDQARSVMVWGAPLQEQLVLILQDIATKIRSRVVDAVSRMPSAAAIQNHLNEVAIGVLNGREKEVLNLLRAAMTAADALAQASISAMPIRVVPEGGPA